MDLLPFVFHPRQIIIAATVGNAQMEQDIISILETTPNGYQE